MSTTTEAEFTGEENTGGSAAAKPEQHPPFEHFHEDGTSHFGFTPMCTGGCPQRPPADPAPEPEPVPNP